MNTAVIVFPGSNCDQDVAKAWHIATGKEATMVWHRDTALPADTKLVILPGGFSYGDYLRSGAIAARSPIMKAVVEHAGRGGMVLGICNGFQVLTELGLLPGVLLRNKSLKFINRKVALKITNNTLKVTGNFKQNQVVKMHIAHAQGCYYAPTDVIKNLQDNGLIFMQYCDEQGNINDEGNPNGSLLNIAGITNLSKNVFGMMPHPERSAEEILGGTEGQYLLNCLA